MFENFDLDFWPLRLILLFKGNGKIFVEAHLGIYVDINANTPMLQNVRKWLASSSQSDVTSSQIIDLKVIEESNIASLSTYKIVTWYVSFSPKSATLDKLLLFVKNGGLRIAFFLFIKNLKSKLKIHF